MPHINRRDFFARSLTAAAAVGGLVQSSATATPRTTQDGISLAEWAVNQEIKAGQFTTLDVPRLTREEYGINAIEFVNTLFEAPTYGYLKKLKANAEKYNVKMTVLMVDDEGDPVDPSKEERKRFVINHRKWIDAAQFLGCHSLRTNCRGTEGISKTEALNWAEDSYNALLEYAAPAKVIVVIENHGGLSDDADWMVTLINRVNSLYFGSYIDWRWREPSVFDNVAYLTKMLPYATGMSYKKQPSVEHFEKMIRVCRDGGYRGYYAIEEKGREGILFAKKVFERVLFGKVSAS